MKLTEERIVAMLNIAGCEEQFINNRISDARIIEAEVLRLNGIGEGERSYACDHDDAVHCSNCYAVTPQQAAPGAVPAREVLEVVRDVEQHIAQGHQSELFVAAQRPGYGTGVYTHIWHQMQKIRAMLSAAPKAQEPGA